MLFEMNSLYLWFVIIIAGVAIEVFTLDLSAIWFGVGGLAALIAASIGLEFASQLIIFVLFSALLLVLVRPFCRKFLKTKNEPTNADRIIGEVAVVTQSINNIQETGEIKILGQLWTARSVDDSNIAAEQIVRVVSIRGVKAIVEKINE